MNGDVIMLERLMEQFTQENGELPKEGRGIYYLTLDDQLTVRLIDTRPGIRFYSDLGPHPVEDTEAFFRMMMIGNLFGEGTLGGVLGLSDDGKNILLTKDIDHTISYQEFLGIFEDFIDMAEMWRDEAAGIAS